ncbi:hypothetical protein JCM8115_000208 [Rhodotorula mucilaginosa]
MTAVESDYTDTFLDLLHHNSAGAALQLNGTALPVDSAANDLSAGPDRLTESGDFAQAHDPQTHAPTAGTSSSANAAAPPAAGPSGAGPSGASSSTRASPANLPSLPDTFPEPPVPVQAEDGSLPARSEFAAGLDAYVHSLHPIKRNKALMPRELYSLIIDILRKPQDTTVGDPQLRFWVRQRFQLMNGPDDRCCALHEGKRVVLRDEIYDVVARAHTEAQHGGRDKTYNVLKRDWSYVPKETVATFIRLCSVCNGKRTKEKKQAADRKEKKSRATSVSAAPTSSQVPEGSAPPAIPSTSELYGLPVNLSNALGQAPVHFPTPPNPLSATAAAGGYYSVLDSNLGGTDSSSSSMALPVPPELAGAYGAPPADAAGQFGPTGGSTFTTAAVTAAAAAAAIEASRQAT